ncbi:MBL fold metallo-hydrolase [Actinopolyspora mortivallis]|nr:MBL fold metallo-hydrolase [Actinopolyspora mortivallis]
MGSSAEAVEMMWGVPYRGRFVERLESSPPRPWEVLRYRGGTSPGRTELDRRLVPRCDGRLPELGPGEVSLTWIGHATFLLRTPELCLLIDPVWSARIPFVRPRLSPPGMAFDALPPVDAVLISHDHYDHLDAATVRRLPRDITVLVPLGLGHWFTRRGFTDVREADWWDVTLLGTTRCDFVPARHWSRRGVWDFCRSLWGGWVVTTAHGRRLYHAGDTGYGPFFAEIGRRFPEIDTALLPIGAYHPVEVMRTVHLTPEDAVRAARDLGARELVGMHWGTFALTGEPVAQPMERLRREWSAAGGRGQRLREVAVGQTWVLSARSAPE